MPFDRTTKTFETVEKFPINAKTFSRLFVFSKFFVNLRHRIPFYYFNLLYLFI